MFAGARETIRWGKVLMVTCRSRVSVICMGNSEAAASTPVSSSMTQTVSRVTTQRTRNTQHALYIFADNA